MNGPNQESKRGASVNPVRGILFLYVSNITGMAMGFVYWFIMARLVEANTVGIVSAAMSVVNISIGLAGLGVAVGSQRHLGRSFGECDSKEFASYFLSGLSILLSSAAAAAICLLLLADLIYTIYSMSFLLVVLVSGTAFLKATTPMFESALMALVKTEFVALGTLVGSVIKIVLGVMLVINGWGVLGVVIGILVMHMIHLLIYGFFAHRQMRTMLNISFVRPLSGGHKLEILKSGFPIWAPSAIQSIGTQIGILLLFGAAGAEQTGFYFMALNVYLVVLVIPSSILGLLFPYISSIKEGQKNVTQKGIRFSQAFLMPVISILLLYPFLPLGLVGPEYTAASGILQVLLVSLPMIAVTSGVNFLAYARGQYRIVFGVGIATNMPRVAFYIILTPLYGGVGAALAFLIGSFTGLLAAFLAARRIGFAIEARDVLVPLLPSIVISTVVWLVDLPWILGLPVVLLVSGIASTRFGIVTRSDIKMIVYSLLPAKLAEAGIPRLRWIIRMLFGDLS